MGRAGRITRPVSCWEEEEEEMEEEDRKGKGARRAMVRGM